jgi:transposase
VDVAKANLVVARIVARSDELHPDGSCRTQTLANRERSLRSWLAQLPQGSALVVESTNTYHRLICDLAHQAGLKVYLINPYWLRSHRQAQGKRAKTDRCDAQLLVSYGQHNHQELRPYVPLGAEAALLTLLLRRRAQLVRQGVALRQSLAELETLAGVEAPVAQAHRELMLQFKRLISALETQIHHLLHSQPHWQERAGRLQQVPGLGPLSTAALLAALERGEFKTPEAFVSFLGLDPVAQDSGQRNGRRTLSKKGDPLVRQILYMAATACMHKTVWKEFAARYKARGLHHTQVACLIARRLAITAWCLVKRGTHFQSDKLFSPTNP